MLKIIEYIKDFFTFILELFKFVGNLLLSLVNILVKCAGFLVDVIKSFKTVTPSLKLYKEQKL